MTTPAEPSGRRRLITSFFPSRATSQASRPTTLLGSSAPDYIDDRHRTMDYTQEPNPPSDHGIHPTKPSLVPADNQLATFRTLVGIDNAPALTTGTYFQRPAENIGIYGRVTVAESEARLKYRVFAFLINFCLGLQIIVAAALTALGAGNGPHKAVTAFGAINTVIAGFLAYLKGSGLPNRLRYYQNEWTKLREYIEQRERDFCREGCTLDMETEVNAVEVMYEEVKGDIEINTPDGFVSVSDVRSKRQDLNPRPPIPRGVSSKAQFIARDTPTGSSFGQRRSVTEPGRAYVREKEKGDDIV